MTRRTLLFLAALPTSLLMPGCSDGPVQPSPPGPSFGHAAREVLHVPRDFATIQAAVDAAQPGDIIQVAPGVYHEAIVVTTSDLRLHGQNAVLDGTPLRDPAATGLFGIHVAGSAASPVTGVEISGLEVRGYERGIVLQWAQRSRVYQNDVHDNTDMNLSDGLNFLDGIVLVSSGFNEVIANETHGNGHDGIQLNGGSAGNLVRANRTHDNGSQTPAMTGCGINLTGAGNDDNRVVANTVLDNHWGILIIGPAPGSTGNFVGQNQIHGHVRAGVGVVGAPSGNVIAQNDASGNGLGDLGPSGPFDLFDAPPTDNTWARNRGTANF